MPVSPFRARPMLSGLVIKARPPPPSRKSTIALIFGSIEPFAKWLPSSSARFASARLMRSIHRCPGFPKSRATFSTAVAIRKRSAFSSRAKREQAVLVDDGRDAAAFPIADIDDGDAASADRYHLNSLAKDRLDRIELDDLLGHGRRNDSAPSPSRVLAHGPSEVPMAAFGFFGAHEAAYGFRGRDEGRIGRIDQDLRDDRGHVLRDAPVVEFVL